MGRFSDEFDYKSIPTQFIRNLVSEEEESLQSPIHAHIIPKSSYAARVHDFRVYDRVSRDVIRRWAYPVTVDNPPSGYEKTRRYKRGEGFTYREVIQPTTVHRAARVGKGTVVGSNGEIGEGAVVEESVVGDDVEIGPGAVVKGSYLWKGCVVGANARVTGAIVCGRAVVNSNAVVNKGAVIGYDVVIGEGAIVLANARVTVHGEEEVEDAGEWSDEDEDDEQGEELFSDVRVVGEGGKGRLWTR